MADNTLDFSQFQRQAKRKPLELTLPSGETLTIPIPDGDAMMDLEEAGTTRRVLRIAFGDQWEAIQPLLSTIEDPEALREFARTVLVKLGAAADDAPPAGGPR